LEKLNSLHLRTPVFTRHVAQNAWPDEWQKPHWLPYYAEQRADERGCVVNPADSAYIDLGVAGFLAGFDLLSRPSAVDARWRGLEAGNVGRFQVPTLRNIDKRPYPEFIKADGHNGYFCSLKEDLAFLQHARCAAALPGRRT
jgi:cytochrome c peroxidase